MSAKRPVPADKKPATKKLVLKPAQALDYNPSLPAYEQLSPDHQRFVDEYITDFNGTKAYLRVPGVNCTERAAAVTAARLLGKANTQRAIQERIDASRVRTGLEITKDRILQEVARLAFVDIRKLYRDDGSMKLPHELDDDTAAALWGLDVTEEFAGSGSDRVLIGHTKKVKLYDKKGNLELLMKHLGILVDKVDIGVTDPLAALLSSLSSSALPVRTKPVDD